MDQNWKFHKTNKEIHGRPVYVENGDNICTFLTLIYLLMNYYNISPPRTVRPRALPHFSCLFQYFNIFNQQATDGASASNSASTTEQKQIQTIKRRVVGFLSTLVRLTPFRASFFTIQMCCDDLLLVYARKPNKKGQKANTTSFFAFIFFSSFCSSSSDAPYHQNHTDFILQFFFFTSLYYCARDRFTLNFNCEWRFIF